MRSKVLGVAIACAALALVACDVSIVDNVPLARRLDPAYALTPETRTLHFFVQQISTCPPPEDRTTTAVDYRAEEIAVSILSPGQGNCLTLGVIFALAVDLSEPVGNRRVVSLDQPEPSFNLYNVPFLRDHGANRPTPSDPGYVSQEQLGAAWPLVVPYGSLLCEIWGPQEEVGPIVVFTAPDGTIYAIKRHGEAFIQLPPIEDIWVLERDGSRLSLEPITERGLELCAT